MSYEKLANLTLKLGQLTDQGKIDWSETPEPGTFQVSFSDYSVLISMQRSVDPATPDGTVDYVYVILDDEGVEIEKFTDLDLVRYNDIYNVIFFKIMESTYQTARRLALGSERAVNSILNDLDVLSDEVPF